MEPFSITTEKGVKLYLNQRTVENKKGTTVYFYLSKEIKNGVAALPEGKEIVFKNGLPVVSNKK